MTTTTAEQQSLDAQEPWRATLLPEATAIQILFGYPKDTPIWSENPLAKALCEAQAKRTWEACYAD